VLDYKGLFFCSNVPVFLEGMADGKTFTAEGAKRDAMTAEERAKDRAAKRTGKPATAFGYNPKTNTASFKKR